LRPEAPPREVQGQVVGRSHRHRNADWKASVARRDVTSAIVELAPVGGLDGRGTRPALIVEQCVADFSQWFALDAAELIALVLAEERGKTWRVERTTR